MTHLTQIIQNGLLRVFKFPELVTVLISVLPIVEARGAIPIAFGYGISPFFAFLYAFIGSSLMAPILIALLLPFVKWLSRTRLFKRIGQTIYEKFEQKSQSIVKSDTATETNTTDGSEADTTVNKRLQAKKFWGVFAFVAIPLPLTGVWTGSAVAAITRLKYPLALAAVVLGNMVASAIITLLCFFFEKWIDYIILAIGVIAIAVVITLIIKIILHKPKNENGKTTERNEEEKE
ncbi:MAG: small multi-drug export protein [Clostridiales bacterium]|nr:small multi-drug export protein [Clostridiales bacterium]